MPWVDSCPNYDGGHHHPLIGPCPAAPDAASWDPYEGEWD